MTFFLRSALVAVSLASALVAGASAPAAADSMTMARRPGVETVQFRDRDGACAPRLALRKAARLGVNRAAVVRDNRRALVIDGRMRGKPVTVRFAQARGCPVLGVTR